LNFDSHVQSGKTPPGEGRARDRDRLDLPARPAASVLSGLVDLRRREPRIRAGFVGLDADVVFDRVDVDGDDPQVLPGLADDTYDVLCVEQVLHRLSRLSVALTNWVRVVRPGGLLTLTVPEGAPSNGQAAAPWRFTVQDPAPGDGGVNLFELLQVICHLVEVERVAVHRAEPRMARADDASGAEPGTIEVVLRKRVRPLTPVQSNNSTEVQMLTRMTRSAIRARSHARPMGEFESILDSGVLDATVVDPSRLYLLYQWLLATLRLHGDCIEVGCFRGGTAKLISETLLRRGVAADLHLFDTFAGMPERLSADEAGLKGCFADTSVDLVRRLLANNPRAHLHAGIFPDSVPLQLREGRFRFAHIDVDIEESVRDCLAYVYPRLAAGGIIVIDDYGHAECPGATRAVEDFFETRAETVIQMPLISSAVVVKAG